MTRHLLTAVMLTLAAGGVRGGVYNLAEGRAFPSPDEVRARVTKLRSAAIPGEPKAGSFKAYVVGQVAELEGLRREGMLTSNELIDLSGLYIRLGRIDDAIRLLREGDQGHFLVQSHLAAAYFSKGETDLALRQQGMCLRAWPDSFAGWSTARLAYNRGIERQFLTFYRLRAAEAVRAPRPPVEVDALFPGLRFVGPSGSYEAGGLAWEMRDKLPADAFDVVAHLCESFPLDYRLYWLLGEMLNADGRIESAAGIFNELSEAGMVGNFRDLSRHRRTLLDALPAFNALGDARTRGDLAFAAAMLAPPAGESSAFALLAGRAALPEAHVLASLPPIPDLPPTPPTDIPPPPSGELNAQHVAISVGFGAVAGMLLAWQLSLWFRPRKRN